MEGNCQKGHERLEDQGRTSHWEGKMKRPANWGMAASLLRPNKLLSHRSTTVALKTGNVRLP